jgi:hypothetical protein
MKAVHFAVSVACGSCIMAIISCSMLIPSLYMEITNMHSMIFEEIAAFKVPYQ